MNDETQPQRWTTRIVSLGRTQPAAKRGGTSTRYRTPSILKHTAASPRGFVGCSRALSENHLRSTKINPRSLDPEETEWFSNEKEARFRPGLNRRVSREVRPRKSLSHTQRNRMPLLVARERDRSNKTSDREKGKGRYRQTVGRRD